MDQSNTCGTTNKSLSEAEWKAQKDLREKPFAELTTDQKIDRLVEVVRGFRYTTQKTYDLEAKVNKLYNHTHADGKVVVDIKTNDNILGLCGQSMTRDPLN